MKKRAKGSKKLRILTFCFIIASVLVFLFATFDVHFTTTSSTSPEHEAEIKATVLNYAQKDCFKSYKTDSCDQLTVDANYTPCGFRGFCGWIFNIRSSTDDFQYAAGGDMRLSSETAEKVTRYSEHSTPYADKLEELFLKMCRDYTRPLVNGCDHTYFGASIDWLGNRNEENDPNIGVAVEYMNPYKFEGKIDRDGKILEASISNFEEDSDKILYTY